MTKHYKYDISIIATPEDFPEEFYKVSVYEATGIAEGHGPELIARHKFNAKCTISGYNWLDCVAPNVNKGIALAELNNYLGINASECVAFGDYYNDIEMLSTVKYGYVMNDACVEIREMFEHHSNDVVETIKEILSLM